MQTIETRRIGQTNTRGTRYKATASGGYSLMIPEPIEARGELDGHQAAATRLVRKLGWGKYFHVGSSPKGEIWAATSPVPEEPRFAG
jgi:hypothetical protein